jgi:DNA-binding NtrC family response regulator
LSFSSAALALLEAQPYPGNVRELGNLVEQLVSQSGHHQVISRREVLEAVGMNSSFMLVAEPVSAAQAPHSTVQDTTKPTVPSPSQPVVQPAVTLANLHEILAALSVEPNDPALRGAKPRLEKALKALVRRCAGAVLELYIDPMKREYRRQPAMQFLNDNENLKGKGPERVLNEILERKQTTPLSEEDLKRLTQL